MKLQRNWSTPLLNRMRSTKATSSASSRNLVSSMLKVFLTSKKLIDFVIRIHKRGRRAEARTDLHNHQWRKERRKEIESEAVDWKVHHSDCRWNHHRLESSQLLCWGTREGNFQENRWNHEAVCWQDWARVWRRSKIQTHCDRVYWSPWSFLQMLLHWIRLVSILNDS